MPASVEKAVEVGFPMVLIQKAAENELLAFLEFELIKLSTMVNVDARLNLQRHQVPVLAQTLYEDFKHESMEDIAVCLKRGAMGKYADERGIFRIDGAVISQWMSRYLEEKYQVIESNLAKGKEKPVYRETETKGLLDLYKAVVGDTPPGDITNAAENSYQRWKLENPRKTVLENPRKTFNIRGLEIQATSQDEAEKIVQKLIELGEVEEVKE